MKRILWLTILLTQYLPAQNAILQLRARAVWQIALNDSITVIRGDTTLSLQAGEYRMLARPEGWQYWQNPVHSELLKLDNADTTIIELPLFRQTLLNSIPGDALVLIGDSLQGRTPLVLNFAGELAVTVSKIGYANQEIRLDGSLRQVLVSLEPGQTLTPKPQNFWYKHRRPALLITTITSNWLAFYLKRQADQAYDAYLHSGKVGEMNHHYERSQILDGASNVFLGLSTVSMVGFLYFTYRE